MARTRPVLYERAGFAASYPAWLADTPVEDAFEAYIQQTLDKCVHHLTTYDKTYFSLSLTPIEQDHNITKTILFSRDEDQYQQYHVGALERRGWYPVVNEIEGSLSVRVNPDMDIFWGPAD